MLSGVRSDFFDLENFKAREFITIVNVYEKNQLNKSWPQANVIKTRFLLKVKYPLVICGGFNILRFTWCLISLVTQL